MALPSLQLSLLLAALALPVPSLAQTTSSPPPTPEQWRAAAVQDLSAIHDLLRDNSPAAVIDRDSGTFRSWLDKGLAEAQADIPKVHDGRSYQYAIRGYINGFRDSHIQFGLTDKATISKFASDWTGFVVGQRGQSYEVVFQGGDTNGLPPMHARLISCDGLSVAQMVAAHDRYDGDLHLAMPRYIDAFHLLLELGNPFVPKAKTCIFEAEGRRRTYPLSWRPLDAATSDRLNATVFHKAGALGIAAWGDKNWWITVPSMGANLQWNAFFAEVQAKQAALREAPLVVIDVRGNGGGDSGYGDHLARMLWGGDVVDARMPWLGPQVWRASRVNRDYWASLIKSLADNPNVPESEKRALQRTLDRLDEALAKGEPTVTFGNETPGQPRTSPPSPMRGKVVVLTDFVCNSACLDLMDEFMAMPNVVQAGGTTSADTIFMENTQPPPLPSGFGQIAFGHKAWIKRPRGSNQPFTPSPALMWNGSPTDENGLRDWLTKAVGG